MKKFFALALAIVMICALSVTCFAVTGITEFPYTSGAQNVTVSYTDGAAAEATYVVDVTWDSLDFTYVQSAQIWDAVNHKEVDSGTSAWQDDTAEITITNHSNRSVWATVTYAAGETSGTAEFNLTDGAEEEVVAAVLTTVDTKVATLTATGVPAENASEAVVGTITITVATTQSAS